MLISFLPFTYQWYISYNPTTSVQKYNNRFNFIIRTGSFPNMKLIISKINDLFASLRIFFVGRGSEISKVIDTGIIWDLIPENTGKCETIPEKTIEESTPSPIRAIVRLKTKFIQLTFSPNLKMKSREIFESLMATSRGHIVCLRWKFSDKNFWITWFHRWG